MVMNGFKGKWLAGVTLVVGGLLCGGGARQLSADGRLNFEPNVACLKGSPYGKVLALAMQGPIGVYFHKGQSHATSEVLNGEKEVSVEGRVEEHAEGCGCGAHDEDEDDKAGPIVAELPFHVRAKKHLQKMDAYAHRKTDGQPMSEAHERYLQSVNEDKLKLAYELDPSNYTNYGNYHLFLSMNDFGKSQMDQDAAFALATRTIEFCKRDQVDPSSWLTASSAAYDKITHIGRNYKKYTELEARESLFEFDKYFKKHEILLDDSLKKGSIISTIRIHEMQERARYLHKLRIAQGIYMKRMMTHQIGNDSKAK